MSRSQRGFSLLEAMFSMFIVFLTLGSLNYTLGQAGSAKTSLRESGNLAEVVHTISLIRNDIAAATYLITPASGTSNRVELERFDPAKPLTDRIDPILDFEAFDPNDKVRVEYFLDSEKLYRRSSGSDAPTVLDPLIKAKEFRVESKSQGAILEFRLTRERERVTKVHQFIVRVQK